MKESLLVPRAKHTAEVEISPLGIPEVDDTEFRISVSFSLAKTVGER